MRSFLRMALKDRGENPFRIGWESAKANAVPMVVLWLFAVGLVVGYYWVVTKTCVARAISKEVLGKAGLISCLDYYNERHALKLS